MKTINFKIFLLFVLLFSWGSQVHTQNDNDQSGLLQHVLMFKWVENINEGAKDEIMEIFKNLPDKIDGFEQIDIYDVVDSSGDFDIILIMQFTNQEALDVYQEHPDHLRVKEIGPPLLANFGEIDYWKN